MYYIYTYLYIYIYVYLYMLLLIFISIYLSIYLSLSISLYIYIYIYMCWRQHIGIGSTYDKYKDNPFIWSPMFIDGHWMNTFTCLLYFAISWICNLYTQPLLFAEMTCICMLRALYAVGENWLWPPCDKQQAVAMNITF